MNNTRHTYWLSIGNMKTLSFLLGFMAFAVLGTANHAQAQNSFNIQLGESPRLLEALYNNSRGLLSDSDLAEIDFEETCVNPVARYQNRNRFSVLVENTSTTNSLTTFSLDLEALGFEFGDGDFDGDGFLGSLAMDMGRSSPGVSLSGAYGVDMTELVVSFSGLAAGDAAIFRVDLDPSASNTSGIRFPDYREAVLGANGNDVALVDVGFSSGNQFTDVPFMAGTFTEAIDSSKIEPYGAQGHSGRFGSGGPGSFSFGISGGEIPEPSTALLFLAGIAGMMKLRIRR